VSSCNQSQIIAMFWSDDEVFEDIVCVNLAMHHVPVYPLFEHLSRLLDEYFSVENSAT
jgi:hypothetical protein